MLVHQEDNLCAPITLWQRCLPCLSLVFLCTNKRRSLNTLADVASCVALGYQTIKEWDYNGGGPLEEKGNGRKRVEEKRRGCTVAALMALSTFPFSIASPQTRALPKSKWEEQQRTPTPGYQGCNYIKLLLCDAGSSQHSSPPAGMTAAACSHHRPGVARMQ